MKRIHATTTAASLAGTILALLLLATGYYTYTPIPYIETQTPPTPLLPVKTLLATTLFTTAAITTPRKAAPLLAAYYSYTLVGYLAWTYMHTIPLLNIILYTAALTIPEATTIAYTIVAASGRRTAAIPIVMATSTLRGIVWTIKPG